LKRIQLGCTSMLYMLNV